MINRDLKPFIVYWMGHSTSSNRSWTTARVHPRFKDFETQAEAEKLYQKLVKIAEAGGEYQSRRPTHVTRSWS